MAFSRAISSEPTPPTDVLTARMAGIGMNFAAEPEVDADIESTLVYASSLGMEQGDLRVLAVLVTFALAGPWMLTVMTDYMRRVLTGLPGIIG